MIRDLALKKLSTRGLLASIFVLGCSGGALAAGTPEGSGYSAASAPSNVGDVQLQLNTLQAEVNSLKREQLTEAKGRWHLEGGPKNPVIPAFVSDNGESFVKIFGRLQLDGTLNQVPHKGVLPGSEGSSANFAFRRVRLGIEGQIDRYWIYKFQYNFTGSTPSSGIKDAFIGYHGAFRGVYNIFLAGNQHVPFGSQTPSNYITFMSHSLPVAAYRPAREIGLAGQSSQKHWNFWYGVFDGRNPGGNSIPYSETSNFAASGDFAINIVNQRGRLIRIGNSFLYNKWSNGGAGFKTTPDAHFYQASLVSSPALLGVRSDFIYSPNVIVQDGPLTLRADYYLVKTSTSANNISPTVNLQSQATFTGWEAQADYVLTGEVRPYSTDGGMFVGIRPLHPITEGGWGAFQVAARLDSADMNDRQQKVEGGRETNLTLALNWYPTSFTRLDLNYVKVFKVDGGPYNGYSPSIGEMRLQFVF